MQRALRAAGLTLAAALILSPSTRAGVSGLTAPQPPYCVPVAYRDYEVVFGRAAALRPTPGCTRPSLVRKVSNSGVIGPPIPVPLPRPQTPLPHVWLFLARLEYTLDGLTWHPLRLR